MRIYIHIPFCESKCKYCRFASIGSLNTVLVNKYVNYLINDIKNQKTPVSKKIGVDVCSIYFGGGTPGILSEEHFSKIINALKENFRFADDIEITLETTPENISKEKLFFWEQYGVNRLSFGIQSLNDKTLSEIKRKGSDSIFAGLELLKTSKINNISVDFIVGLPYVKKGELIDDVKKILGGYDFITHMSLYMLEDYYDVNESDLMYDKITYPTNWNNLTLKDDDLVGEYVSISDYLENIGFSRYELSNFSKLGFECKHNIGYWKHEEVTAFGLGAHGFLDNTRYAFSSDFMKYYNGVYEYIEKLSIRDILLEKVMFGFRTNGLKSNIVNKLDKQKIEELINGGYLSYIEDRLVVTNMGIGVMDFIIGEIY